MTCINYKCGAMIRSTAAGALFLVRNNARAYPKGCSDRLLRASWPQQQQKFPMRRRRFLSSKSAPAASGLGSSFVEQPQTKTTTTTAANGATAAANSTDDCSTADHRNLVTTTPPPVVLFPWRHEPAANALPRVTPGTLEHRDDFIVPMKQQTLLGEFFVRNAMVNRGFTTAIGDDWRGELLDGVKYAFTQSVAAIASCNYGVPLDRVIRSDAATGEEMVDFSFEPAAEARDDGGGGNNEEAESSGESFGGSGDTEDRHRDDRSGGAKNEEEESFSSSPPPSSLEAMMGSSLRDLYRSAADSGGRDRLRIRLETRAVDAKLYGMLAFPFLTRRDVEERNPGHYRKYAMAIIEHHPLSTSFMSPFLENVRTQYEEKGERRRLDTTVNLQVLVQCQESFQVLDAATGAVLQGTADGAVRDVQHLVEFETTVTTTFTWTKLYFELKQDWQLMDIDDLLGQQKWYHKAVGGK